MSPEEERAQMNIPDEETYIGKSAGETLGFFLRAKEEEEIYTGKGVMRTGRTCCFLAIQLRSDIHGIICGMSVLPLSQSWRSESGNAKLRLSVSKVEFL